MRLIDADTLFDFLTEQLDKETGAYSKGRNVGLNIARSALRDKTITPTITPPPNDPLTLDELQEMDGEPVFVTKNGESIGYALVYSPCSIVYITCAAGSKWDVEDLLDEGCKIYRRKPEEGIQ